MRADFLRRMREFFLSTCTNRSSSLFSSEVCVMRKSRSSVARLYDCRRCRNIHHGSRTVDARCRDNRRRGAHRKRGSSLDQSKERRLSTSEDISESVVGESKYGTGARIRERGNGTHIQTKKLMERMIGENCKQREAGVTIVRKSITPPTSISETGEPMNSGTIEEKNDVMKGGELQ